MIPIFQESDDIVEITMATTTKVRWLEIFMHINQHGDKCEELLLEYFPSGVPKDANSESDEKFVRVVGRNKLNKDEIGDYKLLGRVVGRLTLGGNYETR